MSVGNPSLPRPPEVLSRVPVEGLCYPCGYNLHLQEVFCDPDTSLPAVRCPECGNGHDPLALRSDPHRRAWRVLSRVLWLGKLGAMGAVGAGLVIACGLLHFFIVGWFVFFDGPKPDLGRTLANLFSPTGLTVFLLIFLGGVLAGGLFWKRHWVVRVVAAGPGPLLVLLTDLSELFPASYPLAGLHAIGLAAFVLLLTIVGAILCRPVLRGLVRLALPLRSRLFFEFLWTVDGKTMPLGRTP